MNKRSSSVRYVKSISIMFFFLISNAMTAQNKQDTLPATVTISDCVNYALANYPLVKQALLDEDINKRNIRIALSSWWPQINSSANIQHYIKRPVVIFPNFSNPSGPEQEITTGVINNSTIQFSASQSIYNTALVFAGKTSRDLRTQASENTENTKINTVVNVSKAFYDILLSEQQIAVLVQDIQRLKRNVADAFNLYKNGINDKTDYQQASISLNTGEAELKSAQEGLKVKFATLKQLMGYPVERPIEISFDTATVGNAIFIDTLQALDYKNRLEYQLAQTNLRLQNAEVGYYRWSFLPSLSASGNYNIVYQNNDWSQLYNKDFPNSIIGLNLSLPLFQGTSRLENLKKSKFLYQRLQLDADNIKSQINTQYTLAMSSYKSNLTQFIVNKENRDTARSIYNIIKSQYNQGVKTYLNVIIAETDLRTAELNYWYSLYQVLSSILDVKQALGTISIK